MGKYEPLHDYLSKQDSDYLPMSFAEIEEIIGRKLPNSKHFRAWWSNNPFNNVMTNAWLDAGYRTESVDIEGEKLVFRRERKPSGISSGGKKGVKETGNHPAFGFMKGFLTIEDEYDVTKPVNEDWANGYIGADEQK